MTPIDLRIKYRFETGYSPTYGIDAYGHNYKGALTHYYAEWLEGNKYKALMKRDTYQKQTGNRAVYYDYDRKLHYTKEYKEWMESLKCEVLTVLEKLRK